MAEHVTRQEIMAVLEQSSGRQRVADLLHLLINGPVSERQRLETIHNLADLMKTHRDSVFHSVVVVPRKYDAGNNLEQVRRLCHGVGLDLRSALAVMEGRAEILVTETIKRDDYGI